MTCSGSVISPFRGIRYRTTASRDLSSLLAPPYDVIGEPMQAALEARDEYNFVRVELPRPPDTETEQDNRYTRAAGMLQTWLSQGVMIRDDRSTLYALEQEFRIGGRSWRRRGVFAALRMPEVGERYVLSHEATFAGPKVDRLQLMQACEAMTSPILMMSEDPESALLARLHAVSGEPDAVATDHEGVAHRLWALQDSPDLDAICAAVGRGPLFIADGHHRFETALNCRDGMRKLAPDAPPTAGLNHALVLVTSARDEALRVLPSHRLISGLRAAGMEHMRRRMREWFTVRELSPTAALAGLFDAPGGHVFAACSADGRGYLLTAREERLAPHLSPVASLDVSVLHECLIDPVMTAAGGAAKVEYLHDERVAAEAVARKERDFAFLLRPTTVEEVMRVASAGERMPHKSTFFYPKVPAGLVMSCLGADEV
jgi:uncharacterized protein (DUF1015 family)